MGLLDSILGAALGGATGQQQAPAPQQAPGGGVSSSVLTALLPIVLGMVLNRGGGAQGGGGGIGDILGGMLGGGTARGGGGGLGDILGGMLGGGAGGGGLGSLLEQFQRAGFADQANSWVSTGQNIPIPPDAIGQVFGGDAISQIARQLGISEADASQGISQLMPEVVDRLTPNSSMPDLDQLSTSVQDMVRRMAS
jgi:uncharacterized protein YidB (DUF937 family)